MKKIERIDQDHPKFALIERAIEARLKTDFNHVQLRVAEKVFDESFYEQALPPSDAVLCEEYFFTVDEPKEAIKEFIEETGLDPETNKKEFCKWFVESNHFHALEEAVRADWEENRSYPIQNTLFEARDSILSEKILASVDDLYAVAGLGVIDGGDWFEGPMLYITGAGYSMIEKHWIPLYQVIFPDFVKGLLDKDQ